MQNRGASRSIQGVAAVDRFLAFQSRDGFEQRGTRSDYRGQVERLSKLRGHTISHVLLRDLFGAQLTGDGGHDDSVDSARNDEIEIRKIRCDIERESMPRDPVAGMNSN